MQSQEVRILLLKSCKFHMKPHEVKDHHEIMPARLSSPCQAVEAVIKIPKHLQKPDAVQPEGEVRVKIEVWRDRDGRWPQG